MKFKVGDRVTVNGNFVKGEEGIIYKVKKENGGLYSVIYRISEDENNTMRGRFKEEQLTLINKEKPTINDLRDYMLEHFVNEYGDLEIDGLDFSEFDGTVSFSEMKVKGDLLQGSHTVEGSIYQTCHQVGCDLYQGYQKFGLDYVCNVVKYGGQLYVNEPQKILKKITKEELTEMGYVIIDNGGSEKMIDKMMEGLMSLEYEYDGYRGRSKTSVISRDNRGLVKETLLKIFNEEYNSKIGELEAKVYAYEKIISNSNFKPLLENE